MLRLFQVLFFFPFLLMLNLVLGISILESIFGKGVSWSDAGAKWQRPMKKIDENLLYRIGSSDDSLYDDFNNTLNAILVPRVPGTVGHENVRTYIREEMSSLGWAVEEDVFSDRTPYGSQNFANIIATLDPKACHNLVISCHYDSLYNREYTFMGATDSAVPCSMMIHVARVLDPLLKKSAFKGNNVTLQFIFFDGEEAFRKWSSTDSLYGSKHLAKLWSSRKAFSSTPECRDRKYASYLDRMNVMVLLDLIGTANPKFYSYFPDTHNLYTYFVNAEQQLNELKLLDGGAVNGKTKYFMNRFTFANIEDDHIPFMRRGVPIVHLIPSPFPSVWHKEGDNHKSVHHPTVNNLNKILMVFIVQYLNLDIPRAPLTLKLQ